MASGDGWAGSTSKTSATSARPGPRAAPDHPVPPGQVRQHLDGFEAGVVEQPPDHRSLVSADLDHQPAPGPKPARSLLGEAAMELHPAQKGLRGLGPDLRRKRLVLLLREVGRIADDHV